VEAKSWRTTPYEIACGISKGLADSTVVAKVDGEVWDLDRPLEKSCSIHLLKFDDEDAQVGADSMILKIFSPKHLAKLLAVFFLLKIQLVFPNI
jgi:hypothetical protein